MVRGRAAPSGLGVGAIGRGIVEDRHFLGDPAQAVVLLQSLAQAEIDVPEVRDVGGGVGNLRGGQRSHRPVAEAVGLVDAAAGEAGDQGVVADLVAESGHHCGDLGVEQRPRHVTEPEHEYFDILTGGVEHLCHGLVCKQNPKRRQIQTVRLGVDDGDLVGAGDLHQAQFRPVGALPHELSIDGDESFAAHALAELRRAVTSWRSGGRREVSVGRSGHRAVLHLQVRKAKKPLRRPFREPLRLPTADALERC